MAHNLCAVLLMDSESFKSSAKIGKALIHRSLQSTSDILKPFKDMVKDTAVRELTLYLPLAPLSNIQLEANVLVDLFDHEMTNTNAMYILAAHDPLDRKKRIDSLLQYILWSYLRHVLGLYRSFPTIGFFTGTTFE